jgi:hypothetical protein
VPIHVTGEKDFEKDIDVPEHAAKATIGGVNPFLIGLPGAGMFILAAVIWYVDGQDIGRNGLTPGTIALGLLPVLCVGVGALAIVVGIVRRHFIDVTEDDGSSDAAKAPGGMHQ